MFSKNTYILQQPDSSTSLQYSHASTSVSGLNANEILLNHHHDMLYSHYLPANAPPVFEPAVLYNQDGDPSSMAQKTAKRDRHSKIYTSQGPRDRRVRLSIGVARKFFDLQEMLGFDKPSKTLDWLLTKSRTAIKHLVSTKQQAGSKSTVISSLSECEENNNYTGESLSVKEKADVKGKSVTNNSYKNKGAKDAHQQAALNLAKESRVKARARARERTREKMCIKQQQIEINGGYETNPNCSIPVQYMNNQLEVCKISCSGGIIHCPQGYHEAANQEDLIHEAIVNKRKVKHTSIFGFQTNYDIPSSYNATEDWDVNNYASQSSICAILDQHKFNNRSSNN